MMYTGVGKRIRTHGHSATGRSLNRTTVSYVTLRNTLSDKARLIGRSSTGGDLGDCPQKFEVGDGPCILPPNILRRNLLLLDVRQSTRFQTSRDRQNKVDNLQRSSGFWALRWTNF